MTEQHALTQEVKDKWLADLRSGEFKQATGQLRSWGRTSDGFADTYCCLGVLVQQLCDEWTIYPMANGKEIGSLICLNYDIMSQPLQSQLVRMNDTNRRSFSQIADWIEENIIPSA